MATIELIIRTSLDDPWLSDLLRVLQRSHERAGNGSPMEAGAVADHELPEYIKLLLAYERNGGKATWTEASTFNTRAYRDPRGAGGMYTPQAGYFVCDESTETYAMTDKARATLEDWRRERTGEG